MSLYIQKTLHGILGKAETMECPIHTKKDIPNALSQLGEIDALIIVAPLYVDSIPSNVLCFLQQAESICQGCQYHFKVYVVTNSGFIEGHQNEINLAQYECWSQKAGLTWGGGIGMGGGVILLVNTILLPITLIKFMLTMVFNRMQGYAAVNQSMCLSVAEDLGLFLFFSSGMFICEALLANRIKKGKAGRNMYTRFMLPSFLFLLGADIFMLIMSILKGGFFRNLFHRE